MIGVVNRLPVHLNDYVALFQIAVGGRTVECNVTYKGASRLLCSESFRDRGRHILRQDAEIGALDFAILQNLVHYVTCQVNGHRKTDSLIATGIGRYDRGVDTDKVSFVINQRAPELPGLIGASV